ncbi:MAG: hypothetical protein HY349_00330 [Nitrospirae bacterium]|nr:hypothetical protein [Nitrospirota bacterium]
MVFLELALFGIRNFSELTRLAFKPGMNFIQGGNGAGKSTVCDILFTVLSPISEAAVESFRTPKSPAICQAALIFKTRNDRICRLIRDFNSGKSSLAEPDASNKFHVTMQDEEPIAKFLTEETGGLTRTEFEGLYWMKASWMPSARIVETGPPGAAPSAPVSTPLIAPPVETKTKPHDREKKQKRLDELKALLTKGDQLSALEDQLSDLQSRSAEAKRRLRMAAEKTTELSRLSQQGEAFEPLKNLPEDYDLIFEISAQQEQLKNDQLITLAEDEEFLKQDLARIPSQPIFLNAYFIGGGGLTLASIILLSVLGLEGLYQQLLMLMVLAGIGSMGYAGYLDFKKLNRRKGIEHRIRETDRQRLRVEATFKRENAACVELLKKTGCADITSLKDKVKSYEQWVSAQRQLEADLKQFLGQKTLEELEQAVETLTGQMSQIESKLKESSSLPSDIYLIQEEVRVLERDLAAPVSSQPQPDLHSLSKTVMDDPPSSPPAGRISGFLSPRYRAALQTAPVKSVLYAQISELNALISRMMGKLGGSTETELTLDKELMPVLTSHTKAPVAWEALSSGQQDLQHLVHQLAVAQTLTQSRPFPLVLDNPWPMLDSSHQQMVLDILREIAQNTQILLLSSAPYAGREGDHQIKL